MSNREEMSTSLLVKQTNAGNHGPGGPDIQTGQLPVPCIKLPVLSRGQPWAPHPGFCWAQPWHPDLAGIQGPGRNPEASFITPLAFEEVHLYKLIKTGTK